MKIGIFGGSFDPVHSGHVRIAESAVRDLALDRLLVIPAATSPFKTEAPPMFPQETRLMLVRAAFNGMANVIVDDRELRREGVSYAIDTVREIAAENPGAEIFFVIGEDSVADLGKWKDAEELQRLCTFKAYPRTPESSTEIRRRLAAGEPADDMLPESVALFIKHGVRESDDAKIVAAVRAGLVRKEGYCPCRLPKLPEFFCPCAEFRGQLADPAFSGLCHCRLYVKPGPDGESR